MKPPRPRTLVLIEDDAGLRQSLVMAAQFQGYQVWSSDTAEGGLELALAHQPTIVVCDVHLAKGDGRNVLKKLRADAAMSDCQFVMMTGDWVGASKQVSIEISADAYLPKPFSIAEFFACMDERFRQANI